MPETAEKSSAAQCGRPSGGTLVTVIVPVLNEERFIGRTLDGLLAQDLASGQYEVLVVDGQSSDRTRQIVSDYAARHPQVRLLDNPRRWSSAARNVGARAAAGRYLVVIDGHCEIPDRHYLSRLVDAFQRSGADCLGRPQPLDVQSATGLQRAIAAARASRLGHHPASYTFASGEKFVPAHSVAVAYRRDVFERVGFFDESFDACEDVELNHRIDRAGLRCFFTDQIQLRYVPRSSLVGLFRQMVRYGRGRMRLLRKHPDTFAVGSLLPGVLVLIVLLAPIGWLVSRWLAWLLLSAVGLYAAAVLIASCWLAARRRDPAILAWLPFVFPAIHGGAGTGILLESLGVRQRRAPADVSSMDHAPHRNR